MDVEDAHRVALHLVFGSADETEEHEERGAEAHDAERGGVAFVPVDVTLIAPGVLVDHHSEERSEGNESEREVHEGEDAEATHYTLRRGDRRAPRRTPS